MIGIFCMIAITVLTTKPVIWNVIENNNKTISFVSTSFWGGIGIQSRFLRVLLSCSTKKRFDARMMSIGIKSKKALSSLTPDWMLAKLDSDNRAELKTGKINAANIPNEKTFLLLNFINSA